jgi:hypothetical protein
MNPPVKRRVLPIVAAGLAATSLSLTAGSPAGAESSGAAGSSGTTAYSGYSSSGIATPIKVEIFEPTIPIPTVPQAEFDMGYAKIKANSSSTSGRASFVWPGDGIGEGLKTFFAQLGLPTALVDNGYPVQVNSQYPSDTTTQQNSPLPGASMTTTSAKGQARATVGYSTDCDAGDGASGAGDGGGLQLPGLPALPLPDLSGLPVVGGLVGTVTDSLGDLLGLTGLTGAPAATPGATPSATTTAPGGGATAAAGSGAASGDDAAPPPACPVPAALGALIDVNGYVADSDSVSNGATVTSTSRASLGDVKLLGGIITMSGITSTVVSSSDGVTGTSTGRADYGTLSIAGQTFALGPEGYVAAGQSSPIPGLPDNPLAALETLGITVQLPAPTYKIDGDKASGTVEGLVVTIDLKTLRPVLSQINLGPILDAIPFPPQAAILKSLLGSIGNLSPKIVIHLGYTTSAVDTVQKIAVPASAPTSDPSGTPSEEPTDDSSPTSGPATGSAGATGSTGGGGADLGGGGAAPPPAAVSRPPVAQTAAPDQLAPAALSSGLPPLFSIPGLLLFAGVGGALLAGSYVRRLGALVLGAGGACPHGLESGLPDLRKVQP